MKKVSIMLTILLSGSLAACSAPASDETVNPSQQETNEHEPSASNGNDSSLSDSENSTTEADESKTDDDKDSERNDEAKDKDEETNENASNQESSQEDSIDKEQKQMAIDTLNGLVEDGKKGKVYHLNDGFFVGKTTQTDVYNTIGKPERQDTFDRYTGSMGQASYDLRYDENGLLVEARYLGTNVERQTNLGGITSADLREQLGKPDELRKLTKTHQTNYIYKLGTYEIQFIMTEKDKADHVNLLLIS